LIGNEWLYFIDIISFTISKSQMVSLIESSVSWSKQVRDCQKEELWHIDNIEELGTISDIKPHPVSV
jgi:hypothetical protein